MITRERKDIDLKIRQINSGIFEFFVDGKRYGDIDYTTFVFDESFDDWVNLVKSTGSQISPHADIEIKFRVSLHCEQLTGELKEFIRKIVPNTIAGFDRNKEWIIENKPIIREVSDEINRLEKEIEDLRLFMAGEKDYSEIKHIMRTFENEKNTEKINFRISKNALDFLREKCKKENKELSELIREILHEKILLGDENATNIEDNN